MFLRSALALMFTAALAGCFGPARVPDAKDRSGRASGSNTVVASQCTADLAKTRAVYTPLPEQDFGGGCTQYNAVKLLSVAGDAAPYGVSNLRAVSCPMAQGFAAWARYGVGRAASQILGSPLLRIETFGSYSCRNVAGTGRRSAHSSADAVDVSAFVLADGRRISVLDDWNSNDPAVRRFLRVIHASACKRFGTVLGPEYNAAHRNHFHVERGDGSFCR